MLGITHFTSGAVIGAALPRRAGVAAAAGIVVHGLLDCVAHDDDSLGVAGQAVLALAAVGAVAGACGPTSTPILAGIAAAAPDAEVVVWMMRGRNGGMGFPSHWQRPGRRGNHPWQLPRIRVPLAAELAVSAALLTLLCRGRRRPPG